MQAGQPVGAVAATGGAVEPSHCGRDSVGGFPHYCTALKGEGLMLLYVSEITHRIYSEYKTTF